MRSQHDLLQPGLEVLGPRPRRRQADAVVEQAAAPDLRRVPPPVEVDGADHGLHGVGQDRRLGPPSRHVLAPTEQQRGAEVELQGHLGQHRRVDHGGAHLGQSPFGHLGIGPVAVLGHHQPEHGVTEELESLVRRDPARLGAPGSVRQRLDEQARVGEVLPQTADQRGSGDLGGQPCRRRRRRHCDPSGPRPKTPGPGGRRWRPARRARRRPDRRVRRPSQAVPSLATT